jgi:hypothetical protein
MSGTLFLQHMFGMKGKGFMGGTLFALIAYFNNTECLSQQLRKRSSIHGLHGSMSSQTAIEVDFSEVRLTSILRTSP